MTVELEFSTLKGYIKVSVKGVDSPGIAREYFEAIIYQCTKTGIRRVLVEADLQNKANYTMSQDMVRMFKELGFDHSYRLAWVNVDPAHYENSYNVETYLFNRGYFFARVFKTVAEAEAWLFGE